MALAIAPHPFLKSSAKTNLTADLETAVSLVARDGFLGILCLSSGACRTTQLERRVPIRPTAHSANVVGRGECMS